MTQTLYFWCIFGRKGLRGRSINPIKTLLFFFCGRFLFTMIQILVKNDNRSTLIPQSKRYVVFMFPRRVEDGPNYDISNVTYYLNPWSPRFLPPSWTSRLLQWVFHYDTLNNETVWNGFVQDNKTYDPEVTESLREPRRQRYPMLKVDIKQITTSKFRDRPKKKKIELPRSKSKKTPFSSLLKLYNGWKQS